MTDQTNTPADETRDDHLAPIRAQLLKAALAHVPFDGWSESTLKRAAQDTDIDEGLAELAFPSVLSLVEFFIGDADCHMMEALGAMDLSSMKVRERIRTAVKTRLEVVAPHKEAEARAVHYMGLPWNAPTALKHAWNTADLMWRAAGDTSTDYNYYTKRLILSGVYTSTLLVWLQDHSEDSQETWAFLDRRIDDVMQFEKIKSRVLGKREDRPSLLRALSRLRYGDRGRMKP